MKNISSKEELERRKYIAGHAPTLLGHILGGAAATGKNIDPKACVEAAIASAEALFDQLTVTSTL